MRNVEDPRFHVMGKEKMDKAKGHRDRSAEPKDKQEEDGKHDRELFPGRRMHDAELDAVWRLRKRRFAETQDSRQAR